MTPGIFECVSIFCLHTTVPSRRTPSTKHDLFLRVKTDLFMLVACLNVEKTGCKKSQLTRKSTQIKLKNRANLKKFWFWDFKVVLNVSLSLLFKSANRVNKK